MKILILIDKEQKVLYGLQENLKYNDSLFVSCLNNNYYTIADTS